ncbi:hypothetical protein SAMN02745225_00425 [Ferrithrix thermotolerans DSM 19514]|jgi:hypothetical protein|uniref:Uncharacterized protein n=1 Tax=Ferrithrix thermotolerans DSM 19514 TaxID=1121881 RepID=A0A1M4SWZ2_9ACTN|nr:hypothetical protein [Ferrithrix thermotolerans]SHE36715.1 hypothetical protein SAMN02745225_00425 [Ferrithrix thermotolerans DSM 19514]
MSNAGVIDDHILEHYRGLLDAEDSAFNAVEHAYEEGDREQFQADLKLWRSCIEAKLQYLEKCGFALLGPEWKECLRSRSSISL